jgi:hypothetical protein
MISKQIKFLLVLIIILVFCGILFLNRTNSHNESIRVEDKLVNEEVTQPIGNWEPIPVMSCEEIFTNQYHVTFENGVTILTNKPAKIGDTTKCWINKAIDSVVFEKP